MWIVLSEVLKLRWDHKSSNIFIHLESVKKKNGRKNHFKSIKINFNFLFYSIKIFSFRGFSAHKNYDLCSIFFSFFILWTNIFISFFIPIHYPSACLFKYLWLCSFLFYISSDFLTSRLIFLSFRAIILRT